LAQQVIINININININRENPSPANNAKLHTVTP